MQEFGERASPQTATAGIELRLADRLASGLDDASAVSQTATACGVPESDVWPVLDSLRLRTAVATRREMSAQKRRDVRIAAIFAVIVLTVLAVGALTAIFEARTTGGLSITAVPSATVAVESPMAPGNFNVIMDFPGTQASYSLRDVSALRASVRTTLEAAVSLASRMEMESRPGEEEAIRAGRFDAPAVEKVQGNIQFAGPGISVNTPVALPIYRGSDAALQDRVREERATRIERLLHALESATPPQR